MFEWVYMYYNDNLGGITHANYWATIMRITEPRTYLLVFEFEEFITRWMVWFIGDRVVRDSDGLRHFKGVSSQLLQEAVR